MQKKSTDIVKSNALVEACYRPKSVNQMRLLLAALTQVRSKQKLTHDTEFTVTAGALSDMTGNSMQTSYEALRRAAKELMDLYIGVDILPNGREGSPIEYDMHVVAGCKYIKKEGCVRLQFTHTIIPYISELSSHFTKYKAKTMMNLKNRYGIRMYELCMQWIPFGPKREIAVDDFRKIFGMEDRHRDIYNLKRCVILPAIRDVNKNTDLNIEFRQVKSGRVITHFQFLITKKPTLKQTKILAMDKRNNIPELEQNPPDWREKALQKHMNKLKK